MYIAESAGLVRRLDLALRTSSHVYRGPLAPVTSLAVCDDSLVAGCWDKHVWSWSASTGRATRRYEGHADFVKAVLCARVGATKLLLSAGADATIIVWDLISGARLHQLTGHARGVQALALDPFSDLAADGGVTVFSAGSEREIRRWRVSAAVAAEFAPATTTTTTTLATAHETSVYAFHFDADGDLWTASADKTAKCLARERGWATDTELVHPDFVRDVVVSEAAGVVVTACSDEEVRVWDKAEGVLRHVWRGHYEEVTGLVVLEGGREVVSVSLDGTVRRWGLSGAAIERAKEEEQRARDGVEKESVEKEMLTEDEERELQELMDD